NGKFKKHGYTITFHELRHTYATRLIANGVDFKTVAQILGHSVEQTLKTYSHVNNDMLNKAHSVIEKIF
ncbi:site-specific integrase, partial [Clostridium botulinum]